MTKFVLHGGFNKNISYIKDEFFIEALKDTKEDVRVLLVFFAESEESRGLRIKQCKSQFENNKGTKHLEFKMATEDSFLEDCAWADVIFLSGGSTARIYPILQKFKNLKEAFAGKTVVGDSAGVNVLVRYSYSRKTNKINNGLSILPIKVLVHYTEDMGNPLENVGTDLDTVYLHEYEVAVRYY